MGHSRQQYEDRIRNRIGDLGLFRHIDETTIPLHLEEALLTFSKDRPRQISTTVSGDGTVRSFDLTGVAGWSAGWSVITEVEYPTGTIPRTLLDSHYYHLDDETSTIELDLAPVVGVDNVRIRFYGVYPFPDDDPDTDLIHDIYFNAICARAAASCLRSKANEYARAQSQSVAGDIFRYDPAPLFSGAKELDRLYTDTVLGRPTTPDSKAQTAMAVSDVDVFPASLFHRRSDYIEDETYAD